MSEWHDYSGFKASNPLCDSCYYRNVKNFCEYILIMGQRRPYSAASCTVYVPRDSQDANERKNIVSNNSYSPFTNKTRQ